MGLIVNGKLVGMPKGGKHTSAVKRTISEKTKGENNPNWQGGVWAKDKLGHKNRSYKKWQAKHRLAALKHYSKGTPKCACPNCPVDEVMFLTFDHTKGGGRKHRGMIRGQKIYMWLLRNGYPRGFRILCWNCNSMYGLYGKCPHQFKDKPKDEIWQGIARGGPGRSSVSSEVSGAARVKVN